MEAKQITALVLGILGGVFGIGGAIITLGLGGLSGIAGYEKAGEVVGRGFGAILLSILGMIGAGIVGSNPKISGILMLVSAIIGFLIIFPLYIPATALLLAGGILALMSKKPKAVEKSSEIKE